jgi:hypothetical protein
MKDTDTIARLGRAAPVTLVAATQRPTQKVMGQGAVQLMGGLLELVQRHIDPENQGA